MNKKTKYSKEQWMKSKSDEYSKDLLQAILEDGEEYSKAEVAGKMKAYFEKKIR